MLQLPTPVFFLPFRVEQLLWDVNTGNADICTKNLAEDNEAVESTVPLQDEQYLGPLTAGTGL